MTDTWDYTAFGEQVLRTPTTGSTVNAFLFNAQQFDTPTGTYFLRARYYDQTSGRFLSQDPLEGAENDPITLHRYLYAGVNPVSNIDPGGMEFSLSGLSVGLAISSVSLGTIGAGVYIHAGGNAISGVVYGSEITGALLYSIFRGKGENPVPFVYTLISGSVSAAFGAINDHFIEHKSEDEVLRDAVQGFAEGATSAAFGKVADNAVVAFANSLLQGSIGFFGQLANGDFPSQEAGLDKFGEVVTDAIFAGLTTGAVDALLKSTGSGRKVSGFLYKALTNPGERLEIKHLLEESLTAIAGIFVGKRVGQKIYAAL